MSRIDAYECGSSQITQSMGESRIVYRYEIDIRIAEQDLRALVVSDDIGDEVIVGRNLLNWIKVLIDGPNQTVELFT
ncbi:MAG: hypothetical protein R2911_08560 [Caldilineaceae bacterium]